MATKLKNVVNGVKAAANASKSTRGSMQQKQAAAANAVENATRMNVRQQMADTTDRHNRNTNNQNNNQNSNQTNRRTTMGEPFPNPADYVNAPNAAGSVGTDALGVFDFNKDLGEIIWGLNEEQSDQMSSGDVVGGLNSWANDTLPSQQQNNNDKDSDSSANNFNMSFGTTEPINGTNEAREEDIEALQNMPEEERQEYIDYLQNYNGKTTPESIQQWENHENNPWGYEGTPETTSFEDYVGEIVNGDSAEAEAYRNRVLNGEEFDPVQDYAYLAMDDSPEARALWSTIYSDPRAQQAYLDMLGENIDTDNNGVITPEEGGAFWDSMQEYSPEAITYDPNDEYSQWIYGDMGEGYGGGNFQMDAFNQALYTNIIASTIEGGGSYEDLVASGEIGQIVDSSGNDLVESLHLEDDWAASQNANLSESEREEAYNRYMSNLAELNNMYKTSAMAEYYTNGGTGFYIDFGPGEAISDEDAVRMARGYLDYQDPDRGYIGYENPDEAINRNAIDSFMIQAPSRYSEYDDIDSYFQAEEDRRRMASQQAGYQALLNNNAGGNSGYQFISVDAYNSPYRNVRELDNGQVVFVDENGNETTATQITGTRGTRDMNELTGTQFIDPDLAYLIAQNTGLADAGYGVYTDFVYPEPEPTYVNEVNATNPVAWQFNHQDMGEPWFKEPLQPVVDWGKQVLHGGYSTSNVSNQNERQVGSDSNRWGYTEPRQQEIAAEEAYDTINALGGSVQGNTYSSSRR